MHILITANASWNLINFRKSLIERLIGQGHRVTALAPVDAHSDSVRALGCKLIPLKMNNKGTSPLEEVRLFLSILKTLKRERPDAVLSYTIKNNIYSALAGRILKIPMLPNVTGLGFVFQGHSLITPIVRRLYRTAFANAPFVFFQNDDDQRYFVNAGIVDMEQAVLLPGSGIDLDRFRSDPKEKAPAPPVFLLVARMLKDKGVGEFVEAARRIRARGLDAEFQLLGFLDVQNPSAITRETMDSWTAEGIVKYLGTTSDVRPYLKAADCIVLPSWYREGTPRTLLEAGAMSRPIVTTNTPGCRDTVENGVNGYLVEPRNVNELTERLCDIIAMSPDARRRMGAASRKRMETRFDERIVIDAYLRHIGLLTNSPSPTQSG